MTEKSSIKGKIIAKKSQERLKRQLGNARMRVPFSSQATLALNQMKRVSEQASIT